MKAKQRILDTLGEPTVQKMLVMSWWERGSITSEQARELIRVNRLETA